MTKRFFISTDPLDAEKVRALKNVLKGTGWWYWLPHFWLVVDTAGSLTVNKIRDEIHKIDNTVRCLVMEVEPKSWAALTRPNDKGVEMADWIGKTWDNKSL